ncbi:hypothetical protein P1S61_38365 [Streptomyces sp. ME08-AFT2]|nr:MULTISPECIES: hypothetical protein [Streptomyces]MDX2765159.1 hypothetical protein [Streptomyces europaeiscabiei]MDX3314824.1 hypothetical protein [Streptomyces sp. ME08-AFT2]MDX3632531.1 hypothetical protein [Streptomyces europaeiscabiei]MDX3646814.1 hypothetical protein [Streptomyces europaeiscabiei]
MDTSTSVAASEARDEGRVDSPRGRPGELLAAVGFTVTALKTAPMALLEPRRLVADEGVVPALRIASRALRNPSALRRVLHMRRVFHRHRDHLGAISLLAAPRPVPALRRNPRWLPP